VHLDTTRTDECDDFTMMCVNFNLFIFVPEDIFSSEKNAPINFRGGFLVEIGSCWYL